MNSNGNRLTRRRFLRRAGAGAASAAILPRLASGGPEPSSPNEKINIAVIGVGGRGYSDLKGVSSQNIVALCDVDGRRAKKAFEEFPKAKQFRDFRKMLDEMERQIDAVVVGTPDHTHSVACMNVMKRGKHVYCEKPLAHSIREVREVMKAAREHKVITQLGNQGHSSPSIRTFCEWIWDGAIGPVTEVHAACGAFPKVYCQIDKLSQLSEKHDVPPELDWDLWLGPAQSRPYSPLYVPWNWRGWTPFGTGAIGDWICHVVDPAFWALDLGAPSTIQAEVDGYELPKDADLYPAGTQVTYEFPAKGERGPVKLDWYDGTRKLPHPPDLEKDRNPPSTGAVVIGKNGTITHGSHGAGGVRIVPEEKMRAYKRPEPTLPRVAGHHQDWLDAIREGRQAGSNFDYGGPLTELALLGLIAIRFPGRKLEWDSENTRFTNCDEANRFINPPFRNGWML